MIGDEHRRTRPPRLDQRSATSCGADRRGRAAASSTDAAGRPRRGCPVGGSCGRGSAALGPGGRQRPAHRDDRAASDVADCRSAPRRGLRQRLVSRRPATRRRWSQPGGGRRRPCGCGFTGGVARSSAPASSSGMYTRGRRDVPLVLWPSPLARPAHRRVRCACLRVPAAGDADVGEDREAVPRAGRARRVAERDARATTTGRCRRPKPKTRLDKVIDFLTDEKVAFLQQAPGQEPGLRLPLRHPARRGTARRSPRTTRRGPKAEWEAWAKYDFKPWVARGPVAEEAASRRRASAGVEGATSPATPTGPSRWSKPPPRTRPCRRR